MTHPKKLVKMRISEIYKDYYRDSPAMLSKLEELLNPYRYRF